MDTDFQTNARQNARWLWVAIAVFLFLAVATVVTKAPWWDEGYFAGPARNLSEGRSLGSHSLSTAAYEQGDKYLYWSLPLYFVSLAGWFKIFGFSIYTMRAFSVCWGLLLLVAWFFFISRLSPIPKTTAILMLCLACDSEVIAAATNGRMDIMTAALGYGSLAFYVWFRHKKFETAIIGAAALCAGAVFTHPLGLIYAVSLVVTALYFDWRRFRLVHLLLAAIPFLVLAAGWSIYILRDPNVFALQMKTNAARRVSNHNILMLLATDVTKRYLFNYVTSPRIYGLHKLKGLLLIGYFSGVLCAWLIPALRRNKQLRLILILACLHPLLLAVGDNQKFWTYFVHVTPVFLACLSLCVAYAFGRKPNAAWLWRSLLAIFLLTGAAATLARVKSNPFENTYRPVIAFLRSHARPDATIMGNFELMFGLGSDEHLSDGMRESLYYAHRPDWIVFHRGGWGYTRIYEPQLYKMVFQNTDYQIYERAVRVQ